MFRYTSANVNYQIKALERELARMSGYVHHYSYNPTRNHRDWVIDIYLPFGDSFHIVAHGPREAYHMIRAVRWALAVSHKDS